MTIPNRSMIIATVVAGSFGILAAAGISRGAGCCGGGEKMDCKHASSGPTTAPSTQPTTQKATYTCPMDPEIVKSEPGKCSKCGMNLVMKK